ncbi:MAG: alpha/beta hydrolase, partial [Pseudomonadota bacterium]
LSAKYFADLIKIQQRSAFPKAQKLFANSNESWVEAIEEIDQVGVTTNILWGERDWSTVAERTKMTSQISGLVSTTIENSGHFMTLDQPAVVISAIRNLIGGT